ncbi:MAG: hypothetical protein ACLQOO_01280 [Terriglobia bacterium]
MTVPRKKREAFDNEPKVGIFWLVGKRLVVTGTPLAKGESYGEFKTFPTSHIDHWAGLQRDGIVPREMEYDVPPRGRVMYNTRTQQFTLLADRCIIRNKRLVSNIMSQLCLPKNTTVVTDSHYRCARCMGKKPTRKQEEEDWDF